MLEDSKGWIDSFVDYTDNTEPPVSYRRWVAISAIASVMQRKCFLNWGSETFYPNMYIVLVGPPATRKGTAMRFGKAMLDSLGITVAADESSRQKLIKSFVEAGAYGSEDDGATRHSSVTMHCTELTVFLGYQARELLSMLCKFYDCEDLFVYETHARGKESVPNVWANLLGATTPGQLQAALPEDAVGSGFTSRVVFVYEDKKGKLVRKPTLREELGTGLEQKLQMIRGLTGEFSVTPGFEEVYFDWYEDSEGKQLFRDPRLDYYVQRRPTHLFKLAMICAASRGAEDMTCRAEDAKQAISLLHSVEQTMDRVFEGVGSNPFASLQQRIFRVLENRKEMPVKEVARMFADDASHMQLSEAIQGLEQQGKVQVDAVKRTIKYQE